MTYTHVKFRLKQDGTGSNLAVGSFLSGDIQVGGSTTYDVKAGWSLRPDGPLTRAVVECFWFSHNSSGDTEANRALLRQAVMARIDALRLELRHRPVAPVLLARGAAYLPNVHQNFGLLAYASGTPDNTDDGTTILANCCLDTIEIVDDIGIEGVGLRATFIAVSAAAVPA